MEHLIKLLTEEPEKLERLIILFLKLLITFVVSSLAMSLFATPQHIEVGDILSNPDLTAYKSSQILAFVFFFIIIWAVLWQIFAEFVFYVVINIILSLISFLASPVFYITHVILYILGIKTDVFKVIGKFLLKGYLKDSSENAFYDAMLLFNVAERRGEIIHPLPNIIWFRSEIKKFESKKAGKHNKSDGKSIFEIKSRIHEYAVLFSIIYCIVLLNPDVKIPLWVTIVVGYMLLNLFSAMFFAHRAHMYFLDNFETINQKLIPIEFIQKVRNQVEKNKILSSAYTQQSEFALTTLTKKDQTYFLPEKIRILIGHFANKDIAKSSIKDDLTMGNQKIFGSKERDTYSILFVNTEPINETYSVISGKELSMYVYAETDEEISNRFEEGIYYIQREYRKAFLRRAKIVRSFVENSFLKDEDYERLIREANGHESYYIGLFVVERLAAKFGFDQAWIQSGDEFVRDLLFAKFNNIRGMDASFINENINFSVGEIIKALIRNRHLTEQQLENFIH